MAQEEDCDFLKAPQACMILPKVLDLEGIMWSLRLSVFAFDVV